MQVRRIAGGTVVEVIRQIQIALAQQARGYAGDFYDVSFHHGKQRKTKRKGCHRARVNLGNIELAHRMSRIEESAQQHFQLQYCSQNVDVIRVCSRRPNQIM